MKVAVGIIALVFSLIALLQSCAITGLSGAVGETATQQAGGIGMLTAVAMFFGGAFAFGLPTVARVMFAISFGLSLLAKKDFPDMQIWGWLSLLLGVLLTFSSKSKQESKSKEAI